MKGKSNGGFAMKGKVFAPLGDCGKLME